MRLGVTPVERRQRSVGIEQRGQVGPRLLGQAGGAMTRGTGGAKRSALAGTERQPTPADLGTIPDAGVERGLEAEYRYQLPDDPEAERLDFGGRNLLQQRERVAEAIIALGMGIGRGEAHHDLRQHRSRGVALEIGGQAHVQVDQIERSQGVQLAVLLGQELGLAFAQDLKCGAEPAAGPERPFGDRALAN